MIVVKDNDENIITSGKDKAIRISKKDRLSSTLESSIMRRERVPYEIIVPLVLFVLFQELARDNWYFLELTFSSFIFVGFVSFQLFRTPVERVSRNQKCAILTLSLISLTVVASVAISLVTIPRGGRSDSLQISPHDVEGTVFDVNPDPEVGAYYFNSSGDPWPIDHQIIYRSYYSTGYVTASYQVGEIRIETQRNVTLNGRLIVRLDLYNHHSSSSYINLYFNHTGYISVVKPDVSDYSLNVGWDGWNTQRKGPSFEHYDIFLILDVSLKGSDFGPSFYVKIDVPEEFRVAVKDVQMISVYTNGFAIFLCGLFTGIYGVILGKTLEKLAAARRTEVIHS